MTNQKTFFHSNIRFLRERKRFSQEDIAQELGLSRNKLQALESGKTINPAVADLIKFSGYFKISIDTLLKMDLAKLSELKIRELQAGNDVYTAGSKIRVLAITTDKEGKENVEFIPVKAKAGYMAAYNDPEFISTLPKFQMPNLPKNKTFRMFPITGDSMLPFEEGDCIITEYVEDWSSIKDETLCILLLKGNQDFVFKQVVNRLKEKGQFVLHSLNKIYKPYAAGAGDLLEVWKYHSYWSKHIRENTPLLKIISDKITSIQKDLDLMKKP